MAFYIIYNGRKLFWKGRNGYYYPSYSSEGALEDVPEGYKVAYNKRGLPYMKREK